MLGGFSVVAVPKLWSSADAASAVASALGQVLGLCRLYKRGKNHSPVPKWVYCHAEYIC